MFQIFDKTINLEHILAPIIYIIMGMIVYYLIKRCFNKISQTGKNLTKQQKQKTKTLHIMVLNIIKYVIVIIEILAILSAFGVNVKSIVAGLGITTAIIGLAFQDLAKDLIAGFSIITENQYEIGDIIEVDNFRGEVIFIGLKTTRIRNYKGATKIIANHNMDNLINYSLHTSLAVLDINVSYDCNPDKVEEILLNLADKLEGTISKAKGKMQVLGIENLDESSVKYRVVQETAAAQEFEVERQLRKAIKKEFDNNNIEIPYQQIEVHNGK